MSNIKREYHYLVAGLPELFFDINKLRSTTLEFKIQLLEDLHRNDYKYIESYFLRFDNQNLLALLKSTESTINALGNYTREDFDEIFSLAKDGSISTFDKEIPQYFEDIILAFKEDDPIIPNKNWENQITELYYQHLLTIDNEFIKNWYSFELDLSNIQIASNCKKHEIEIENNIIGSSELNAKLVKSNARDFGISNEFPAIEAIIRALDEENFLEREKKIDQIKWELLDEWTFFNYFTIEKIFAYLLKVEMVERWLKLDKPTGEEMFNKLLENLETSYEFPQEFENTK